MRKPNKPPRPLTEMDLLEIRMRAAVYDDPQARTDIMRLLEEIDRLQRNQVEKEK